SRVPPASRASAEASASYPATAIPCSCRTRANIKPPGPAPMMAIRVVAFMACSLSLLLEHGVRFQPLQLRKLGCSRRQADHPAADDRPKKQSTRMLKAECPECDYTVWLAKKWADVNLPSCQTDAH